MTHTTSQRQRGLALAALLATTATQAGPLNPFNFQSLGTLTLAPGAYTLDTGNGLSPPVLRNAAGAVLATGVNFDQQVPSAAPYWGYNPLVSVFSFDAITIAAGATVTAVGANPVSLLSRSTIEIAGILDASATRGANGTGSLGGDGDGSGGRAGAGGGDGGDGGGARGNDGFGPGNAPPVIQPGVREIGGYGQVFGLNSFGNGAGHGGRGGGGFGGLVIGSDYGDEWLTYLQGGAGGGGTGRDLFLTKGAGGGGGGGAIELGAIEDIRVVAAQGQVLASGNAGGGGGTVIGGGGSGGALLIHGNQITGGFFNASGAGTNGGGGRVVMLTAIGDPVNANTIAVNRGTSYGEPGTIRFGVQSMDAATDQIVASLTTGSPVSLSQTIAGALPGSDFDLTFKTLFQTGDGTLEVLLDGISLGTLVGPGTPEADFVMRTLGVDVDLFSGLTHLLTFTLDGPTGSRLLLDDVVFPGLVNGGFQRGLSPWTIAAGAGDLSLLVFEPQGGGGGDIPVPASPLLLLVGVPAFAWAGRRREPRSPHP